MNDIERQQEEMKQNILRAIDEHTAVTIAIEDPCALASILDNVWVRSVELSQQSCLDDSMALNIDAYGKRYDIVNREYDDLENIV